MQAQRSSTNSRVLATEETRKVLGPMNRGEYEFNERTSVDKFDPTMNSYESRKDMFSQKSQTL